MSAGADSTGVRVESCELCVVGAGIGGLNAVFAASRYLGRNDRVVLVDRRPQVGGMWTSVYPYVRLHQPYPMFTAGNIAWQLREPKHHLASRDEVLAHLQRCFDELRRRVDLQFVDGYEYQGHSEDEASGLVSIRFSSSEAGGRPLRIEAKRLVDARGFGVTPKRPLALSSRQVTSVSPDFLDEGASELGSSEAPIYVVGGGKTGMDTAHMLVRRFPGRPIHLLVGSGTLFIDREKAYPKGLSRYFSGNIGSDMFLELARLFDGDNEDAVTNHFREHHGVALSPACRHHMFGVLSQQENEAILRGVREILFEHLVDVEDRAAGPTLLLRSGKEQKVAPGSIFINTTGYFGEGAPEYQPYTSPSERVIAINLRSAVTLFSSYAGYLLVDAAYRGSLARLSLYELDTIDLMKRAKGAVLATITTHTIHNVLQLLDGLPLAVQKEFGANFALWYPLHRQMLAGMRLMRFQAAQPDHCSRNLDRIRERFGIRLGPLSHEAQVAVA